MHPLRRKILDPPLFISAVMLSCNHVFFFLDVAKLILIERRKMSQVESQHTRKSRNQLAKQRISCWMWLMLPRSSHEATSNHMKLADICQLNVKVETPRKGVLMVMTLVSAEKVRKSIINRFPQLQDIKKCTDLVKQSSQICNLKI